MTTIQNLMIAVLLAVGTGALPVQAEDAAAVSEIVRLKDAGVAENTIVAFIRSQNKNYDLSAENLLGLREKGVSQTVLNAMLQSGKTAVLSPSAPEPVYTTQPLNQPIASPAVVAQPAIDQDAAYFHQELSPYGRWLLSEESQWYWQPTVAIGHPEWRPYWDQGQWIYTDHGWYWSSDYPWGWAAFHYGRWNLHPHHGWIWYPDREWAPAWVTWRIGGEYCGWAPLPQYSHYDYSGGGLSYRGSHVEANFGFGLAWNQFSFSHLRDMGERPRARFRNEAEARKIYSQTTVINNYSVSKTIVNNESRPRIVNQGIDPRRIASVKGKTVEAVRIQDRSMPSSIRVPERVDARTKTLEVYRPRLTEPSQPERGKAQPAITRPSLAAPPTSPRNVSPNPQVAPAPRPSVTPIQAEPRKVQQAAPPASPTQPSSQPGRPVKRQEDSKKDR